MNNISCVIKDKKKCFGCRSCYNVCKNAITIQEDEEGFFYPVIDEDKCTDCGVCRKVCPSLNKSEVYLNNSNNPECFAVMAKDDIRAVSSSGGAFSVIANEIFCRGGVVCGVSFVGTKVKHIIIDDPCDMYKLRGSKYVQSDTCDTFFKIKQLLKTGRLVLFTGTPCQVAGLNSYLGKTYKNLLTVDLVCHGVPPQKVFDKYIQETLRNDYDLFLHTSFRDKIHGWGVYVTITTIDGHKYYGGPTATDCFLQAFINNMDLRPCCGVCPYTSVHRESDITIGDFWAIERYKKELNDNKGTSLVLLHNEKGKKLFEVIKSYFTVVEAVPIDYAKFYNITLYTPLKQHKNRSLFFKLLNDGNYSLNTIVEKCNNLINQ